MGRLLFDNEKFCRYIAHFFESYRNRSIANIGSLDVSRFVESARTASLACYIQQQKFKLLPFNSAPASLCK
jgi:hypothetical protein